MKSLHEKARYHENRANKLSRVNQQGIKGGTAEKYKSASGAKLLESILPKTNSKNARNVVYNLEMTNKKFATIILVVKFFKIAVT